MKKILVPPLLGAILCLGAAAPAQAGGGYWGMNFGYGQAYGPPPLYAPGWRPGYGPRLDERRAYRHGYRAGYRDARRYRHGNWRPRYGNRGHGNGHRNRYYGPPRGGGYSSFSFNYNSVNRW